MYHLFPVLTKFLIFACLSLATSILIGRLRCFTLGPVAFFMIGAYTSAVLTSELGLGFGVSSTASIALAALAGALVGLSWKWLKGDHYAVITLAFAEVTRQTVVALAPWTGGNRSLIGIKPITIFSVSFDSLGSLFILSAGCFLFTVCVVWYLSLVPANRHLISIGMAPAVSASVGINPLSYVVGMHALAASLCALSGILYAGTTLTLNPNWFTVNESIVILLCCIIGGARSAVGVVLGTTVVFLLPLMLPLEFVAASLSDLLGMLGLGRPPSEILFPLEQALFGVLLIACVLFLPEGLAGFAPKFRSRGVA